jgi:hypothetical protein
MVPPETAATLEARSAGIRPVDWDLFPPLRRADRARGLARVGGPAEHPGWRLLACAARLVDGAVAAGAVRDPGDVPGLLVAAAALAAMSLRFHEKESATSTPLWRLAARTGVPEGTIRRHQAILLRASGFCVDPVTAFDVAGICLWRRADARFTGAVRSRLIAAELDSVDCEFGPYLVAVAAMLLGGADCGLATPPLPPVAGLPECAARLARAPFARPQLPPASRPAIPPPYQPPANPPADQPPANPPADQPPADQPPADQPPADQPPADPPAAPPPYQSPTAPPPC